MLGDAGSEEEHINYTAHAARAFFANGGKRLYIARVFGERVAGAGAPALATKDAWGYATQTVVVTGGPAVTWRARWPGKFGEVHVAVSALRTKNVAFAYDKLPDGTLTEMIETETEGS